MKSILHNTQINTPEEVISYQGRRSGYEIGGGGTNWCVTQPFPAGGLGGALSPPAGSGAEPLRQTHFCKNILRINLKSGLFSVAVYTPTFTGWYGAR